MSSTLPPTPTVVFSDWQIAVPQEPQQQAREEAERIVAEARKKAEQITASANSLRARTLGAADAEAAQVRKDAHAETAKETEDKDKTLRRSAAIDRWSPRIALAATIGLTASGEMALAMLAGWASELAWLLPLAIDVYVVQAFRRHRDVPLAILLMVAANATYHLADATGLGMVDQGDGTLIPEWWLVVGVAAIAPFVMWRIHQITGPLRERKKRSRKRSAAAPTVPAVPAPGAHGTGGERPARRSRESICGALIPVPQVPASGRSRQPVSAAASAPNPARVSATVRTERPARERPAPRSPKPKTTRSRAPKQPSPTVRVERRVERVQTLTTELGRRPEWTEIRDALVADGLADSSISRSTCQRLRDAAEDAHADQT